MHALGQSRSSGLPRRRAFHHVRLPERAVEDCIGTRQTSACTATGRHEHDTTRLEAFSDGGIAIIIPIMVLEPRVPHDTNWAAPVYLSPVVIN
jgi:hypothetical protein